MAVDLPQIQQRLQSIPPRVIGMMHPMLHTLIIKDLPGMVREIAEHRAKETELQEIIKNQWLELVEHRASIKCKEEMFKPIPQVRDILQRAEDRINTGNGIHRP